MHAIVTGDQLAGIPAGQHALLKALKSRVRSRRLEQVDKDFGMIFGNLHARSPCTAFGNGETATDPRRRKREHDPIRMLFVGRHAADLTAVRVVRSAGRRCASTP
jgi:hypothetical protein